MSAITRIFLDAMFANNAVFVIPAGALFALVLAEQTGQRAMLSAIRCGLVLLFAGLLGGAAISHTHAAWQPLWVALATAAGISILHAWGDLQGEWLGLPKTVIALFPMAASPLLVAQYVQWGQQTALAVGLALGFVAASILLSVVHVAIGMSEANRIFKTLPVLLFAMGVFALLLFGFVML